MGQVLFAPALAGCTSDDVTASAAQVLSGYTALTKDSNDDPISGTMTNRGAWTSSSSGSGHIAIPAGYHNGSGYVDCSGAYNAGVTAADARANTSSANYKAGIASVTVSASASGRTVTATASNGKTASASVAYAGSNGVVSVSTSGGSGNQSFDITDGWCTSIKVDRTGAYNKGVTDADARTNTSSANYKAGYNAGVAAADARANTSSANYKAGYNAGKSSGPNSTTQLFLQSGTSYVDSQSYTPSQTCVALVVGGAVTGSGGFVGMNITGVSSVLSDFTINVKDGQCRAIIGTITKNRTIKLTSSHNTDHDDRKSASMAIYKFN